MRSCEHSEEECVDCRRARWGSIGLSQKSVPTRRMTAGKAPRTADNPWERGIPTDDRGVPYLDEKGGVVYQKEFVQNRRKYRRHNKNSIEVKTTT